MKTAAAVAVLVFVSGVTIVRAQEEPVSSPRAERVEAEGEVVEDDEAAPRERPHIQVLQHPYEISSFYRQSQPSGPLAFAPYAYDEADMSGGGKYPIAGFYRSGASARGAYSGFWTTGYRGGRSLRGRGFLGGPRARSLGRNGDLCLFAPTFLAPVGPLTGVFWER